MLTLPILLPPETSSSALKDEKRFFLFSIIHHSFALFLDSSPSNLSLIALPPLIAVLHNLHPHIHLPHIEIPTTLAASTSLTPTHHITKLPRRALNVTLAAQTA
jgi:hypothetical protein